MPILPMEMMEKNERYVSRSVSGAFPKLCVANRNHLLVSTAQTVMNSTKEIGRGTVQGLFIAYDVVVCKQFGKLRFANGDGGKEPPLPSSCRTKPAKTNLTEPGCIRGAVAKVFIPGEDYGSWVAGGSPP
jgi:hypothetical protein